MVKLTLTFVTIFFLATSPVLAQEAEPKSRVKIRTEYQQSPDTPSHLVFWMILYSTHAQDARDHDIAVEIIQKRFRLGSVEEAELMLAQMLDTLESLQNDQREMEKTLLCGPDRVREKRDTYRKMDAVDDARAAVTLTNYITFKSGLDEAEDYYLWE